MFEGVRDSGSWLSRTRRDYMMAAPFYLRANAPLSAYAAYVAIYAETHFDTAAAGGTTYPQACYATASGAVSRVLMPTKLLSASGTASVSRLRTISKGFTTSGTGTVSRVRSIGKVFTTTGQGTVSRIRTITKTFSTTGTASVAYADALVLLKQLIAAGSGAVSSIQTFIAAPPPLPPYRKWRRAMLNYLKRR
jgi:hypothetical protein